MVDHLTLLTKNDIPFVEAGVTIHAPTIRQIGLIGETAFWTGAKFLSLSKEDLPTEEYDKIKDQSMFNIFISFVNSSSSENKVFAESVLLLLFPLCKPSFLPNCIALIEEKGDNVYQINEKSFDAFQDILKQMFVLNKTVKSQGYNIDENNALARKLKEQFERYHRKLAEKENSEGQTPTILTRYISILSVGEHKDMNSLCDYTVYQLFDEFDRFLLQQDFDLKIKEQLAGATNVPQAQNWMKDIHLDVNNN